MSNQLRTTALSAMLGLMAFSGPAAAQKLLFEEPFGDNLRDGWSWLRAEPGTWKTGGGKLTLRTLSGTLWRQTNTARNFLLRTPPVSAGGVATEVTVMMKPEADSEQAGLIWYSGDDDYVKLVVEFKQQSGQAFAILGREQNGAAKVEGMAPIPGGPVALRLEVGEVVRALYRGEGGQWQAVGECAPVAAGPAKVGLFTHVSPGSTDRSALFEAFRIVGR